MIVKLTSSMAGDRFSFKPGQIIKCSEKAGKRLVEHGIAKPAPAGADVDDELFDEPPPLRKQAPEKAVKPAPETPEAKAPAAVCQGETTLGNPCKKAALPGKKFCAKHEGQK